MLTTHARRILAYLVAVPTLIAGTACGGVAAATGSRQYAVAAAIALVGVLVSCIYLWRIRPRR